MLPIEALMSEHRTIELILPHLAKELERMQNSKTVNTKFVGKTVNFIRIYADRTHHGKEEGVLFRDLRKKSLSEEHAAMMMELIEEHAFSRRATADLEKANVSYVNGNSEAWRDVWKFLNDLSALYPKHIEKEDKKFFYPAMEYFSPQEHEAMLNEFWDFDKRIIHEEYKRVVSELEKMATDTT